MGTDVSGQHCKIRILLQRSYDQAVCRGNLAHRTARSEVNIEKELLSVYGKDMPALQLFSLITDQKEMDSLFETRMIEKESIEIEWILFLDSHCIVRRWVMFRCLCQKFCLRYAVKMGERQVVRE